MGEQSTMNKTLAFIGSGNVGGTLARLAVAAGMDVVLSNSRGPESLAGLVAELGPRARAATVADAYEKIPAQPLAGKIVIDTLNYYPERDGRIAELDANELTSSELVQRHLADSRVVKAASNIVVSQLFSLARPSGAPDRSAMPIAGDDAAAKAEVVELLDILGYDAVDIGTLADSWRSEPNTPVYVQPYMPAWPEGMSQEEAQRWFFETPGVPVPAGRVTELIDSAVQGPAGGMFPRTSNGDIK
jgi:predicted dinucleotide-binding enzyme